MGGLYLAELFKVLYLRRLVKKNPEPLIQLVGETQISEVSGIMSVSPCVCYFGKGLENQPSMQFEEGKKHYRQFFFCQQRSQVCCIQDRTECLMPDHHPFLFARINLFILHLPCDYASDLSLKGSPSKAFARLSFLLSSLIQEPEELGNTFKPFNCSM